MGPQSVLRGYTAFVEEHVRGVRRDLRVLADLKELQGAKVADFSAVLNRLAQEVPTAATVWFVYPDGTYYSSAQLDVVDENLRDRGYFKALLSGKEVYGELVISKSTGHRSIVIAVPVTREGKVVGGVGVSLRVRLLSELVERSLRLPENWYFYALDPNTKIVLHRRAERMFRTPAEVGDEALGEQFRGILGRERGDFNYTLQGESISSIFDYSSELNWYFFLAHK
jgi:methyl-accepting chemotaxis protein